MFDDFAGRMWLNARDLGSPRMNDLEVGHLSTSSLPHGCDFATNATIRIGSLFGTLP